MKRTVFLAGLLAASAASADALLWMVDLEDSRWGSGIAGFDAIRMTVTDGTTEYNAAGYTTYYEAGFGGAPAGSDGLIAAALGTDAAPHATAWYATALDGLLGADFNAGSAASYSFTLELLQGGEKVGWMYQPVSGTEVLSYYFETVASDLAPLAPSAYNFGPAVVPEPSSGLLLLAGGAFLALRRRRARR